MNTKHITAFLGASTLVFSVLTQAQSEPKGADKLYWGDLHVHSNLSPDAFAFGNSRLTANDAYQFAQGQTITSSSGHEAQLSRPLDFLLVADHAEFIGVFPKLIDRDPAFMATELGARWATILSESGDLGGVVAEWLAMLQNSDYEHELSSAYRTGLWQEAAAAAENNNKPGQFTAFVGYEWTSMIDGNNLHRVVLFRDAAEKATRKPPFSALDSRNPEDLWNSLAAYESDTGGRVMAIPHNGNISNGYMFALNTLDGKPISKDYAIARSRWEPLYEVTQVKGDSETHPFLSPEDEFADFETWDDDNIARTVSKTNAMLQHEYARSALKLGLKLGAQLGTNPFEFGLMGSTDSHTSLATADDNNYWGKFPDSEPGPERLSSRMGGTLWENWRLAASGYTAVWARDNTREELFDALARREVYATTGPRIGLRFFGGWDFSSADAGSAQLADIGYRKGVPMGSTLSPAKAGRSPTFLLRALKDPEGGNLDRIQIVKGWMNSSGELKEQVYDVALSDERRPNPDSGPLHALPSGVDLATASYRNDIGATNLGATWKDPQFDPGQPAFYYARVIEIATPRWTAFDARDFEQKVAQDIPMITRERVYSSPIWYTPTAATQINK